MGEGKMKAANKYRIRVNGEDWLVPGESLQDALASARQIDSSAVVVDSTATQQAIAQPEEARASMSASGDPSAWQGPFEQVGGSLLGYGAGSAIDKALGTGFKVGGKLAKYGIALNPIGLVMGAAVPAGMTEAGEYSKDQPVDVLRMLKSTGTGAALGAAGSAAPALAKASYPFLTKNVIAPASGLAGRFLAEGAELTGGALSPTKAAVAGKEFAKNEGSFLGIGQDLSERIGSQRAAADASRSQEFTAGLKLRGPVEETPDRIASGLRNASEQAQEAISGTFADRKGLIFQPISETGLARYGTGNAATSESTKMLSNLKINERLGIATSPDGRSYSLNAVNYIRGKIDQLGGARVIDDLLNKKSAIGREIYNDESLRGLFAKGSPDAALLDDFYSTLNSSIEKEVARAYRFSGAKEDQVENVLKLWKETNKLYSEASKATQAFTKQTRGSSIEDYANDILSIGSDDLIKLKNSVAEVPQLSRFWGEVREGYVDAMVVKAMRPDGTIDPKKFKALFMKTPQSVRAEILGGERAQQIEKAIAGYETSADEIAPHLGASLDPQAIANRLGSIGGNSGESAMNELKALYPDLSAKVEKIRLGKGLQMSEEGSVPLLDRSNAGKLMGLRSPYLGLKTAEGLSRFAAMPSTIAPIPFQAGYSAYNERKLGPGY